MYLKYNLKIFTIPHSDSTLALSYSQQYQQAFSFYSFTAKSSLLDHLRQHWAAQTLKAFHWESTSTPRSEQLPLQPPNKTKPTNSTSLQTKSPQFSIQLVSSIPLMSQVSPFKDETNGLHTPSCSRCYPIQLVYLLWLHFSSLQLDLQRPSELTRTNSKIKLIPVATYLV